MCLVCNNVIVCVLFRNHGVCVSVLAHEMLKICVHTLAHIQYTQIHTYNRSKTKDAHTRKIPKWYTLSLIYSKNDHKLRYFYILSLKIVARILIIF